MRIFSFIFLISLTFLNVSCAKEKCAGTKDKETGECVISEFQKIGFFNIVYETLASRQINATQWTDVLGCREMKLESTANYGVDDSLPSELEGRFIVSTQSFKRTLSSGSCTGGNKGGYILTFTDQESESAADPNDKPPYSVFDPYNDVIKYLPENEDDNVDSEEDLTIRTYMFSLKPDTENMTPVDSCGGQIYCPVGVNAPGGINQEENPCSYSMKIVRFPNGHLILDDITKGVQYYLKPRLSSDSASKCIQSNIPK